MSLVINNRTPRLGVLLRAFIIVPIFSLLYFSQTLGHELVDADRAVIYLKRIREQNAVREHGDSVEQRAEASFALGETLANIVESLNRDLMTHHGELGFASTLILHELKGQGIELIFWPDAMRYKSYVKPFEQYVALLPEGPRRADALFRIVQGRFYDSFIYDPLLTVDLKWLDLIAQIMEEEAFLARYPDFRNREEAHFILAVNYVRAARQTLDAKSRSVYVERAQVVIQEFITAYPKSLRATAAQLLLESLP